MINSISKNWGEIEIPLFNGKVSMLPFELNNIATVPTQFREMVKKMIKNLPIKEGKAFLTVHGKELKKNQTLRRPGAHIDGNYIEEICSWGNGGGNGWKVGEGGRTLDTKHHNLSYNNPNGGMIIASNYSSCIGWNGKFKNKPKEGGDCSHLNLKYKDGFMLEPNTVYYGNSQFVHESLPVKEDIFRVMARITLPMEYPIIL